MTCNLRRPIESSPPCTYHRVRVCWRLGIGDSLTLCLTYVIELVPYIDTYMIGYVLRIIGCVCAGV